ARLDNPDPLQRVDRAGLVERGSGLNRRSQDEIISGRKLPELSGFSLRRRTSGPCIRNETKQQRKKIVRMKTKSTSRSAFFIPRVALGGVLCSAGVFLAVAALNKSVAETPAWKATATQSGTWTATGSMNFARIVFTATLLTNGKVLVAGGFDGTATLSSAELYDPATGLWTPTGSMTTPRLGHTATLLQDGRVLVAGGTIGCGCSCSALASAELYDPITGTWTLTGNMNTP